MKTITTAASGEIQYIKHTPKKKNAARNSQKTESVGGTALHFDFFIFNIGWRGNWQFDQMSKTIYTLFLQKPFCTLVALVCHFAQCLRFQYDTLKISTVEINMLVKNAAMIHLKPVQLATRFFMNFCFFFLLFTSIQLMRSIQLVLFLQMLMYSTLHPNRWTPFFCHRLKSLLLYLTLFSRQFNCLS